MEYTILFPYHQYHLEVEVVDMDGPRIDKLIIRRRQ